MPTEDELAEKIRDVGQLYDESRRVQKELWQVLNQYQLLRDIPDPDDPKKKAPQINPQTLERFTEAERNKIKTALDKRLEDIKAKVDKLKEEVSTMPEDEAIKEILTEIDKELIIIMQKRSNLRQLRKDIEMVQAKAPNSVIDLTPIRDQMIQKIKSKAEELKVKKDA